MCFFPKMLMMLDSLLEPLEVADVFRTNRRNTQHLNTQSSSIIQKLVSATPSIVYLSLPYSFSPLLEMVAFPMNL